jgi:hypothetical protein
MPEAAWCQNKSSIGLYCIVYRAVSTPGIGITAMPCIYKAQFLKTTEHRSMEVRMQTSTDWLSYSPSRLISDDECEQYIEKVLGYYQLSLRRNSEAISFLSNECGLSEASTLGKYKLGFADRTLAKQLGAPNTFAGESVRGLLQRIGLMKPNGREAFLGMIIVPVMGQRTDCEAYTDIEAPSTYQETYPMKHIIAVAQIFFLTKLF